MLIDFTVENYRSIKEPVTLSAVAQSRSIGRSVPVSSRRYVKPDSDIASTFSVEGQDLELLPVLGIFGANASGKTNTLTALDQLLFLMYYGNKHQENLLERFPPFLLDEATVSAPTRFQLRVALEGNVYIYSICLDQSTILWERLQYLPATSRRVRLLFERHWNEASKEHTWKPGSDFHWIGSSERKKLQPHQPLISLLSDLPHDLTKPLTRWLEFRWLGTSLSNEDIDDHQMAAKYLSRSPQALSRVTWMLQHLNTGVVGIKSNEDKDVTVLHDTREGRVEWPLEEESLGTQRLFRLAARIQYAFEAQTLVLVDELGVNVHHNVSEILIQLFQSPVTNPKRVQLIFTSHDNTLLQGQLLRRDQIWFTQKRLDGSTELYPLTDFKPRNDLALDKAYLDGRFGAVPILPSEEELFPRAEVAV